MKFLFTNNANSYLRQDTGSSSVTFTLPSGGGAGFPSPNPAADERAMVTIEDRRVDPPQLEICRVISRSADVIQVIRAQEGTTAQNFLAGATISCRMTAGTLLAIQAQGSFLYAGPWDHDPAAGELNPTTGLIMPTPIPMGMQYFNTGSNTMKVWTGSAWAAYSVALLVDGSNSMAGNLRMNDFDLIFAPDTPGETVIDGGGGSIVNMIIDEGTF